MVTTMVTTQMVGLATESPSRLLKKDAPESRRSPGAGGWASASPEAGRSLAFVPRLGVVRTASRRC